MSDRRFFIKSRFIKDGYASFDGDLFNHIARVLRLNVGDSIILIDEKKVEHSALIDQITRDWLVAKIVDAKDSKEDKDKLLITVIQALPKGEKIDFILQKGCELGVDRFIFFQGRRSIVKITDAKIDAKLQRWEKIATEASRQCKRDSVPQLIYQQSGEKAIADDNSEIKLLLFEDESENSIKNVAESYPKPNSVALIVGPEGGFEKEEAMMFKKNLAMPVTLGKRILRTETAALATVAILQYIWGDI